MDLRDQGSAAGARPDHLDQDVAAAGRERREGRPAGVPGDARAGSEGRPLVVRGAVPGPTPRAEDMPTEDPVERGEARDTEHQPGGDL